MSFPQSSSTLRITHQQTTSEVDPSDHQFRTARHAWPNPPKTPLHLTTQPLQQNWYHTFMSVDKNNPPGTGGISLASSLRPAVAIPRAPTPPLFGLPEFSLSNGSSATGDSNGPDRLFGPPLVPHGDAFAASVANARHQTQITASQPSGNVFLQTVLGHSMAPSTTCGAELPREVPSARVKNNNTDQNNTRRPDAGPATGASNNLFLTVPFQDVKDVLARDASNVTPGVDDTPYILFALDALSGNIDTQRNGITEPPKVDVGDNHRPTNSLWYPMLASRPLSNMPAKMLSSAALPTTTGGPLPAPVPAYNNPDCRQSTILRGADVEHRHLAAVCGNPLIMPAEAPVSSSSSLSTLVHGSPHSRYFQPYSAGIKDGDSLISVDHKRLSPQAQLAYQCPDFKPAILRPLSLVLLFSTSLLMTAGFTCCALYSKKNSGLVNYSGSIYSRQFFLFRVLAQLSAVVVLLYAQSVALAIVRIRPFIGMEAHGHPKSGDRNGAIFHDLYPLSFFWPQIIGLGRKQMWPPLLGLWMMNFAVPLQSSLFSSMIVNGARRWATVQGVAWTLVGLYLCLAAVSLWLLAFLHHRQTGLLWDPRSIADVIVLASNSNTLADYRGSELLATRNELRTVLHRRTSDRLGYWAWRDGRSDSVWHGFGTEALDKDVLYPRNSATEKGKDASPISAMSASKQRMLGGGGSLAGIDAEALTLSPHADEVRYRYLPWCLRSTQLLFFIAVTFLLLLSLIVVSFLPSTNISEGFLPRLDSAAIEGAFSAANFLYSFLPALLGQIMSLGFADLELSLRVLQPWAELSKHAGGGQSETSIFADYAACLPLQSAWHAARNRRWRLAILSLMSTTFAFLPAFAGGVFLALTLPSGEVRMVPNMVLYGFVLAVLALYFVSLIAVLPGRKHFRLPHAVMSIAEILSFCANDDLMREPIFKNIHSEATLRRRLGTHQRPSECSRWIFGPGTAGDDRRLGIRRVRRYTELTNRPSRRQPREVMR